MPFEQTSPRAAVRDLLEPAGYHMSENGEQAVWTKGLDDGTELEIRFEAPDAAAQDGDPDSPEWLVGRTGPEGASIRLEMAVTLPQAIGLAARIPDPRDMAGAPLRETHDGIHGALQAERARVAEAKPVMDRMGYAGMLRAVSLGDDGNRIEIGLVGPGAPYGNVWSVIEHDNTDPDDATAGTSGVAGYDDRAEAEQAFREAVTSVTAYLAPSGPSR